MSRGILTALGLAVCSAAAAAGDADLEPPAPAQASPQLEELLVTGSRIPRTKIEGPAPVVIITQDDIRNSGFATIPDVMSALTQNLGALDNNQYTDGFSPGAQAVDLRGLGPNHTLVLVNGRRIADYPQSYGGNSNFTDISQIPASLVDRIEILSGSASAVYGSDAISGVINFIMKERADGTTVDLRLGTTDGGGYQSERLQISSGFSTDRFDSVFAIELFDQKPLWAYQRSYLSSRNNALGDTPDAVFARLDGDGNYIDPGQATCNALSHLDNHQVFYATSSYGNYCGSNGDVGYRTLENGRKAVNFYGSSSYKLTDSMKLFLDLQVGYSDQLSDKNLLQWTSSYSLASGSADTPFFNAATGQVEEWQRQYFTVEEEGGLRASEIRNLNNTLSINTGLKGSFGQSSWAYEVVLGHSQSRLSDQTPAILVGATDNLYLGPALGTDPTSGFTIYNAPVSRLYTPLTPAQFASISRDSTDNDKSRSETLTLSINNPRLLDLPAGPLGFAAVIEGGNQEFDQYVDPLSLNGSYYSYHNTAAVGQRNRFGTGLELSVPVVRDVTLSLAGRYDSYTYSGNTTGKFTYSTGLEYRPIKSLLVRGSYATGFRAPDLSYLYSGLSGSSSNGIDYYRCRKYEPTTAPTFSNCDYNNIYYDGESIGSTSLKDETSTSYTYGVVFSPVRQFQFTADYYAIRLANEVEYQSSDTILREEADCRLGETVSGQPVNINSALCQSVLRQVSRNPVSAYPLTSEVVNSVLVLPINAAVERTTGIDFSVHYLLEAGRYGNFDFNGNFTDALSHTIQLYPGDPVDNEFTDWYDYVLPRNKASYSAAWIFHDWTTTLHGSRLGGIPNYAGTERLGSTAVYNLSSTYHVNRRSALTVTVDNLLDTKPPSDPTWITYPYYSRNWFSPVGRSYYIEFSYRFDVPQPAGAETTR